VVAPAMTATATSIDHDTSRLALPIVFIVALLCGRCVGLLSGWEMTREKLRTRPSILSFASVLVNNVH